MENYFIFDERLGIPLPALKNDWERIPLKVRQTILAEWESIRGRIPDRIAELENEINAKQAELDIEADFPRSCRLNSEIAGLASTINELWLWYRANQEITGKTHQ